MTGFPADAVWFSSIAGVICASIGRPPKESKLNLKAPRYSGRSSRATPRSAHWVTSRRGRRLIRGLADDKIVPGTQFSGHHRRKGKIGHPDSYLNRLKSFIRVQLPDNASILALAVSASRAPTVLAATTARARFAPALRPSCPTPSGAALTIAGTLAPTICGGAVNTGGRHGTDPPCRGGPPIVFDAVLRVQRLALAIRQIRFEAQRPVGNLDDVVGPCHGNGNVRGHAWKQSQVGIIELDGRVIRYDVLNRCGVHAYLGDFPVKRFPREGIHPESGLRSHLNAAHVSLVGVRVDQHVGQVLPDAE